MRNDAVGAVAEHGSGEIRKAFFVHVAFFWWCDPVGFRKHELY